MSDTGSDFMSRGYLLPHGCRDLIDLLNLKSKANWKRSAPPAPRFGEIGIPGSITVRILALLLSRPPFEVIADLMGLGIFANVNELIGFEIASVVVRKYGLRAKRVAATIPPMGFWFLWK